MSISPMIKHFYIEGKRVVVKPVTRWTVEKQVLWTSECYHSGRDKYFYQVVQCPATLTLYKETYINAYFAGVRTTKQIIETTPLKSTTMAEFQDMVRCGYTVNIARSEYDQTPLQDFFSDICNTFTDEMPKYYPDIDAEYGCDPIVEYSELD
jgi:hypothetical protein